MNETTPAVLYEPTSDERTMATLAHALMIIGGWLAPLIIWLVKRESKFVSFHALQALWWQVCVLVGMMFFVFGWIGLILFTVFHAAASSASHPSAPPPLGFFILAPIIWLCWIGIAITNIVLAIVYAIKAGHGEWADYPVIGRRVRRMMHLPSRAATL